MTDQEIDVILQDILKLGREDDTPGQVRDAIYRLSITDGGDLFNILGGIALTGHPELGKSLTVGKGARLMVKV